MTGDAQVMGLANVGAIFWLLILLGLLGVIVSGLQFGMLRRYSLLPLSLTVAAMTVLLTAFGVLLEAHDLARAIGEYHVPGIGVATSNLVANLEVGVLMLGIQVVVWMVAALVKGNLKAGKELAV